MKTQEKDGVSETQKIMRAWDKLQKCKRDLIRQGKINGDASMEDVLQTLKKEIPADMLKP